MAYFDSSKNRALWEIELQSLRKARADRQAGKTSGEVKQETSKVMTGPEPVKMTYADLLQEEAAFVRKTPGRERSSIHMEKRRKNSWKNRQRKAGLYDKQGKQEKEKENSSCGSCRIADFYRMSCSFCLGGDTDRSGNIR